MLVILAVFSAAATRGEVATILFFGELGLALSLPLGVVLTASLVNRTLTKEVKKAKDKLSKINPKVVAITGSYGKTTTKDFLTEILQRKYITEKTIRNENTDFGIARKIINHFREDTEMFVVEMGAYRKGDIERLCEIVNPRVGVITGIEPQHAELFSGIDAIVKTKFELIEALPGKSLAVFNTSNPLSNKLYEKAKKLPSKLNVQGCYVKKKGTRIDSEWSAEITKVNEEGVWFEVFGEGTHRKLFTPVAGVHFVENLLVSIAVARYFKISWKDIGTAVSQVKVKKGTMSVTNYPYGSVIVNDTYNSTPNGFESAIRYLENFKNKKKLIITSGIIELGSYSKSVHKKIGRLASKTTDELIVTNSQYAGEMSAGLGEGEKVVSFIDDTDKLIEKAEEYIEAGAVILLEGRLPYKFMNFIDNRNSQHK
jgi:UDP-N-acetylmuramoyl-tripeptide--D-alanyl-D-alanine ligase